MYVSCFQVNNLIGRDSCCRERSSRGLLEQMQTLSKFDVVKCTPDWLSLLAWNQFSEHMGVEPNEDPFALIRKMNA